jgi:hypothetical protein
MPIATRKVRLAVASRAWTERCVLYRIRSLAKVRHFRRVCRIGIKHGTALTIHGAARRACSLATGSHCATADAIVKKSMGIACRSVHLIAMGRSPV